ncbi:MAG: hypothetical protein EYC70_07060 [Planctomycetota bacterium]|nr:MAG: hypothetical protein EYC70_07060 [Planctomycetota bacterium]
MTIRLTRIRFIEAGDADRHAGLLGWVSCTLDGRLRLDGLALRRTSEGRIILSYPARWDRSGFRHYLIRPLDTAIRRKLESQVLRALGLEAGT